MSRNFRLAPRGKGDSFNQPGDTKELMARTSRLPSVSVIKGFAEFIKNGNIVDLAVAVVIGTAFAAMVTQFTDSFLNPLIAVTTGGGDVGGQFTVNGQTFTYGAFIGSIITFLNTAAVVYFLVVLPINKLMRRNDKAALDESGDPSEVELLEEIRDLLRTQQQHQQQS